MIFSPLIGDQIFHLAERGQSIQIHENFFDHWLDRTAFWLLQGDISPLHSFIVLFFTKYFYTNIFFVKFFYFILICLCPITFSLLIYQIIENRSFGWLALLIPSILYQYQNWHDVFLIFPLFIAPLFCY